MQWSLKKTFLIPIGHVVGCGGINFAENKTIGKISWDIIHPDFQGKSLGTKLLKYRIEVLENYSRYPKNNCQDFTGCL